MPELPEVETVRRGLSELIISKLVGSVSKNWDKSFPNDPACVNQFLIGSKILSVRRRAKVLIIELSTGYSLVVHLKMTGQLVYSSEHKNFGAGHPNSSLVGNLPDKSTRVEIVFSDGSKLYFNDQRKFGWMRLVPSELVLTSGFLANVGPEPLEPSFGWRELKTRLRVRPNTAIKTAMMDQKVLAGVGNIYADESLWAAKINPKTISSQLSLVQIKRLHQAIIDVLNLAIDKGGSTDRNYVNAKGQKGSYIEFAKVFRREGQPCPRCGTVIEKIWLGGRGTHYCPHCQKLPAGKITS